MLKKIVILGPESTGKSTLCRQLAAHYKSSWCPEYAREYLLKNGMNYTYDDLLTIAHGQINLENSYVSAMMNRDEKLSANHTRPLFIDTDMHVMKVWCEFVFEKCHRYILDQIAERVYDLYLLCNIDLPWVKDDLREYPDLISRQRLYKMYRDILINQALPWIEISGNDDQRVQSAIAAVDESLKE